MSQYLLIVFLLVSLSQAFNVDIYEPIVRVSLQNDDFDDLLNKDMFGYRVALYNSTAGPRFIVGAPRGSVVGAMRPNPGVGFNNRSYGVVYNCPVEPGVCTGFVESSGALYDNRGNLNDEQKNGQLMGATIKVGEGGILVCAPRYIRSIGVTRNPIGTCYRSYGTGLPLSTNFTRLGPNDAAICESFGLTGGVSPSHLTTGVCGAGTSGEIRGSSDPFDTGDTSANIVVGLPGDTNWQGAFIAYSVHTSRAGVSARFGVDNSFLAASSLFGYDMVYYQASSSGTDVNIAVSAPRAYSLAGSVGFFNIDRSAVLRLPIIIGPKAGSYFGASLAAVDFNGDGIDELVVGAPTYSEDDNVNIGQIVIYQSINNNNFTLFRIINGTEPNAQFGYALANLGDIDRNGLEDFAVGAPFGTGSGAVYIFSGVGGTEMIRQTQVIIGSELNLLLPSPRSFGFSLSNAIDVDGNGYPDFAVGSYLSQQVYLLRSRPVANMSLEFILPSDILNLDTKSCMLNGMMSSCIDISACFSYSGMSVEDTLNITYEFVIEGRSQENIRFSRGLFMNGASRVNGRRSITKGMNSCVDDFVHFRDNATDEFTPISVEFFMSLDPVNVPNTDGNTSPSTLSSGPVLRVVGSNRVLIPLIRNCGPDERCIPDLVISAGSGMIQYEVNGVVNEDINSISTGVVTAIRIPILLANHGNESALGPIVTFDLPRGTGFIRAFDIATELAQICRETDIDDMTRVECDLGFNLPPPESAGREYIFRIQTRGITGSEGNFGITFIANNGLNEDSNPMDNSHTVNFTVTAEADVFIQSSFRPDSVQIGRLDDMIEPTQASDLGPAVLGQFVVRNSGPSLIPTLQLEIIWPSMAEQSNNSFIIYPSRIMLDSTDVECNEENIDPRGYNNNTNSRRKRQSNENQMINCAAQHAACVTITCTVSNLRANESSTIRIEGFVDDRTFMGTTSLWTFTAFSRVTILTDYITQPIDELSNSDTANLMGIPPNLSTSSSDDGVEAWVIIVPIIGAIIIIVVAAILLYFLGFFKRKKVDKGDEVDLATWQTPGNGEGETTLEKTESTPASEDPST